MFPQLAVFFILFSCTKSDFAADLAAFKNETVSHKINYFHSIFVGGAVGCWDWEHQKIISANLLFYRILYLLGRKKLCCPNICKGVFSFGIHWNRNGWIVELQEEKRRLNTKTQHETSCNQSFYSCSSLCPSSFSFFWLWCYTWSRDEDLIYILVVLSVLLIISRSFFL